MKSPLYLALGAFVALPSIALANEPAKGTLIMVSSVGIWVLLSSVFMVSKGARPNPRKGSGETEPADKNQNSTS